MEQLKIDLHQYLDKHSLMALSTCSDNPWVCFVYYIVDKDFNFYFISPPDSKHAMDIVDNATVAAGVADSRQKVEDIKMGVQMQGTAEEVSSLGKVEWFFKMWAKLYPGNKDKLNFENYRTSVILSKVYKITPSKIKWFNEGLDDEEVVFHDFQ